MTEFSPLFNHLWQSTLFAGAAALLVFALRRNQAALRYKIWLIASLKFLVPFSLLVLAGSRLGSELKPSRAQTGLQVAIEQLSGPFSGTAKPSRSPSTRSQEFPFVPALLLLVWVGGFGARMFTWSQGWLRMRAALDEATPIALRTDQPIEVKSAPTLYEPGVFGIFRPVLLLPDVMLQQLTPEQMAPILVHELTHVRRRDNLASAIHVVVEALFWFHPIVWWLGARLIEERERACDEAVLHGGADPQVYAQSILTTCRLCLESPVACVSGVTGADLKDRVERIVRARPSRSLGFSRKLLLAVSAGAVLLTPIAAGILTAPQNVGSAEITEVETATIRRSLPGLQRGRMLFRRDNRFTTENISLREIIAAAYQVKEFQISGGPDWIDTERFDVNAKTKGPEGNAPPGLLVQKLIADRFRLQVHREPKQLPAYALVVAQNGPKLRQSLGGGCADQPSYNHPCGSLRIEAGRGVSGEHLRMAEIAELFSRLLGRLVINKTGLNHTYDVKLDLTSDRSPAAMLAAIRQQLGLEMKTQTAPVEVLVIDHAEKPSINY